jgi:hypothetical protein
MSIRTFLSVAACAVAISLAASLSAQQGSSPFTIRRPPDGSTVREKVRIEIPRASIQPGGFVAFYIDDKFQVAVAPEEATNKPFVFFWDTKATKAADGEHTIRAVLFQPTGNSVGDGMQVSEAATSEVKLLVANKVKGGPTSVQLRYNYREGENMEYVRQSTTKIYMGDDKIQEVATERELDSVKAQILLGIEDSRPAEDVALVRNKLTKLAVLQSGQETRFDPQQLSASMYQELNAQGKVLYETGTTVGLTEFLAQGLPVNNTLELPLLPATAKTVGQTWNLPGQRLDIPGLPPALQPRVTLSNKFEGLEWEGGYPTVKIRQTADDITLPKLTYGNINIEQAKIQFERIIYVAYKSGTLVKTERRLTITGRTFDQIGQPSAGSAMAGGMMGGRGPGGMPAGGMAGMSGMMMPPGIGGPPPGVMSGRGRGGMPGDGGMPPGMGGPPPGVMSGRGRGGMPGGGGMPPGIGGPPPGVMSGRGRGGMPGGMSGAPPNMGQMMGQMMRGGRMSGAGMSRPGLGGGAMGGAVTPQEPEPITLKTETITTLVNIKQR